MFEQIEAVIFDLDGTLVDSMWLWPEIDTEYLEKYELTEPEGFHDGMEGMSFTETAQYFIDTFSLEMSIQEIMDEWMEMCYDKYANEVDLKRGVTEILKAIKGQNIKIGIATSNDRVLVEALLDNHKIAGFFDAIATADEVKAGKPAPDVYLKAAEDLGVSPAKCLIFEDLPNGILAGKNAGMRTCAVEDPFTKDKRMKKKELADYYIRDYFDILNQTYEVL